MKTVLLIFIFTFLSFNAYSEISITCTPYSDQDGYKFYLILDESSNEAVYHGEVTRSGSYTKSITEYHITMKPYKGSLARLIKINRIAGYFDMVFGNNLNNLSFDNLSANANKQVSHLSGGCTKGGIEPKF